MAESSSLIAWKTQAWTDANMVAWYAKRMFDSSGTLPLKNRIERNLVDRFTTGKDILDVGIGTGRGSLPLAHQGYKVTGIDSSQAMLDETRRQAGSTPIELKIGDVQALPLPDASFDTLLSLNVVVHFPHWQPILEEWKRVLRPGGRIIFDIHSMDHLEASLPAEEADRLAHAGEASGNYGGYMSHLRAGDLADWADANGFRIKAIVPVGAFFGGPAYNQWLTPLENRFYWKRLLSWLGHDKKLLDFAAFLEETIIANLTSSATCRFFAVLDKVDDLAANALWRAENTAKNTLLATTEGLLRLNEFLPAGSADWENALARHLAAPRNRQLLYLLLRAVSCRAPHFQWLDWIPKSYADLFSDWILQENIDEIALATCRDWPTASSAGQTLTQHATPLPPGLEYALMESLLTRHFGVFSGTRT